MAINPKRYIDKLTQGLEQYGKYYNVSTKRFYSNKVNRYVTKYTIEDKDDKSTRIEVYNKLEVLKYLVREWCKVTGKEVPEACIEKLED